MRLLNTTTFKLHEFFGSEIPYYAILSHRWAIDEVTFQDLQQGRGSSMAGWAKVEGCCAQALKEGWEYAWIDSCCIDKSSSVELSEAINSMFQWYKDAQVCYAYLADVPTEAEDHEREGSAFRNSKWFTRGWTLQELLAPQTVVFFNHAWVDIGTRYSFEKLIASITNIDAWFLTRYDAASVAQKFSWASRRQTLRVEDVAYCLMGLFRVNMPLLYGEGGEAFLRLQLEIMRLSDDDSLFAWSSQTEIFRSGLLAPSPTFFQHSGDVITKTSKSAAPYSMTNKGLHISLILIPALEDSKNGQTRSGQKSTDQFIAPLNCFTRWKRPNTNLSSGRDHILLHLRQITEENGRKWYTRIFSDRFLYIPSNAIKPQRTEEQILIPQFRYSQKERSEPDISILAIHSEYAFSNTFVISSISAFSLDGSGDSVHRLQNNIHIMSQVDKGDHESDTIIELKTYMGQSYAVVKFEDRPSPGSLQETFVMHIYRQYYFLSLTSPTIGVTLLPPDGKPLDEVAIEDHPRDRDIIALPSGRVITATLRKQARKGKLRYVVGLDICNDLPTSSRID